MAGINNLLKKAAMQAPPAPKKETAPLIDLPKSEETIKAMKTITEQKQIEKAAESIRKQAEATLRPVCQEQKQLYCQDKSKFFPSVKIKCDTEGPMTFVQVEKYSKIGPDKEDELKAIFAAVFGTENADANYEKCFGTNTEISLTEKGMKVIEELLPLLTAAADKVTGKPDSWLEIFSVEQCIKPTNFLHANQLMEPKLNQVYKKAVEAGILKPQTPHFVS